MKKRLLLIFFISIQTISFCQFNASYLGKSGREALDETKYNSNLKTFTFDSLITVKYVNADKFYVLITYIDTIVAITQIQDNGFYDEPSTVDTTYIHPALMEKLSKYFLATYNSIPQLNSIPTSFINLFDEFGLRCRDSGTPTKLGKKYIEFKKANLQENEIKNMILSFNPYDRLIGVLLFDFTKHTTLITIVDRFISNKYQFDYCYGCLGREKKTIVELLKIIK